MYGSGDGYDERPRFWQNRTLQELLQDDRWSFFLVYLRVLQVHELYRLDESVWGPRRGVRTTWSSPLDLGSTGQLPVWTWWSAILTGSSKTDLLVRLAARQ